MMKNFTTGIIAGTIATVAGMAYILNNEKKHKKLMQKGKKMAYKAEDVMSGIADAMDNM